MDLLRFCYMWVLPPGGVIALLCLGALILRLRKKAGAGWLFACALLLWVLSLRVTANLLCWPLERTYPQPPVEAVAERDVLIMTGAGSVGGVPDITGVGQPGPIMGKSMLTAFRLQRMTGLPLLVSGGEVRAENGREADIALREFTDMGVPKDRLLFENASRNTAENASMTRDVLAGLGLSKAVAVAPALHLPRVVVLFRREGVDVLPYPSHYRRSARWTFSFLADLAPTAENLEDTAAALREYLAHAAIRLGLY